MRNALSSTLIQAYYGINYPPTKICFMMLKRRQIHFWPGLYVKTHRASS